MKAIVKCILLMFLVVCMPESTFAACTDQQKQMLVKKGISQGDIAQICDEESALPGWLSGMWRVDAKREETNVPTPLGFGPISGDYRIQVQGHTLAIATVRDALLKKTYQRFKPLTVSNVALKGKELRFTVRNPSNGSRTDYVLNFSGEDEMHGRYQEVTRGEFGLPPVEFSGSVSFFKQEEFNY